MISNTGGGRLYQQIKDRLTEAYHDIHQSGEWIDSKYTASVENKLKKITNRKHAKLVTSGTTAIQTAILAWNIIDKSVACTNYSYVASVNQAALLNNVDFFDVNSNGIINIDQTFHHDAVIPVSLYGNTIDYDKLKVSEKTKIIVDCAQSLGSKYKGKPDGSFGDVAIFSFARNKPVPTAGTHGALVWDDDSMVHKINSASINGKINRTAPIDSMGVNGTPFELQAAWIDIGLDYMDKWQTRRKNIHAAYTEAFENLPLAIIQTADYCESNCHKFAMLSNQRDMLYDHLQSNEIQALKHYTDNFANFFGSNKTFPITDKLCNEIITLPNHAWLKDSEVEKVIDTIRGFYK